MIHKWTTKFGPVVLITPESEGRRRPTVGIFSKGYEGYAVGNKANVLKTLIETKAHFTQEKDEKPDVSDKVKSPIKKFSFANVIRVYAKKLEEKNNVSS